MEPRQLQVLLIGANEAARAGAVGCPYRQESVQTTLPV